jgi:pimeloyl-ACP methyl ester carboxylesterase
MTSSAYQSGPTVVLVHGAFADAGSWAPVTERLVSAGVPVMAIVNPLRGVKSDAAYVASAINQIPGPVLAVGHSYGGMIITNAVPQTQNVVGLVYVAAFAPDEGETLAGIVGRSKDRKPPSSSSSTRPGSAKSSPPT